MFLLLFREIRSRSLYSHLPTTTFSAQAYQIVEDKHAVFISFPEIDDRIRPLSVEDVSYDVLQTIAKNSEVELTLTSPLLSEVESISKGDTTSDASTEGDERKANPEEKKEHATTTDPEIQKKVEVAHPSELQKEPEAADSSEVKKGK